MEVIKPVRSYHDELVQKVKDLGQELIERAENIVPPDGSMITDFTIHAYFEQDQCPHFSVDVNYLNKTTINRIIKGE